MAKKRANGEGSIRKRKDGRWEGRYTAGYDAKTGKRITKNVLGKTQAEVREKLKKALEECQGLDVSRTEEYTVAAWLRTWYELYAKPNVRTATANRYELIIERYTIPRIGSIKLKKLTTRHLQKLYKELLESGRIHVGKNQNRGLSTTTVHSVHLMLHCALDRAVKERLIPRNPCEDCIVPKPQKLEMKILPPEDMKAYLDTAEARGLLPMFYLELVSGLRKGELVALRWDDLDIQGRTISVSKQYVRNPDGSLELTRPKTENSVRLVSIPQTAVDLLIQEHAKHPDSPYMFPSPLTGEMYHPDSVVNLHKKILKDARLEHLRFHDLRHTFATTALQNGCWATSTPASPCGPTPTPHVRSRTRRPPPWAASWSRSDKDRKKNTPDRKPFFLSGALMSIGSIVSFPRVGHGVGQKFLTNPQSNFLQQKIPKNRSFRGFLELLPRFELGTSSLPRMRSTD